MRSERALRLARGARSVEQRRVVLRREIDLGERSVRQAGPTVGLADPILELADERMRDLLAFPADENTHERRTGVQMLE